MSANGFSISTTLRDFIEYIRASHLEDVARENLRRVRSFDLPLLRFTAHLSEDEQIAAGMAQVDGFLGTLLDGTAREVAAAGLRAWEADEIPGIPKASFEPRELLLVGEAHEGALVSFVDAYTDDRATATAIMREVRAYYANAQLDAYEVFSRIRDEAVELATRAEAERQAAAQRLEETQSLNEELVSQQEELNELYGQLQAHAKVVEREVARQTEALQAANEELEAHHEELLAVNEQLHEQASELATQKAFVENLVRHVPIGLAYLDRDHIFRWVNPEFASFASMPVDAFEGHSYYAMFPSMENPNPRLTAVFESGEPARIEGLALDYPSRGGMTYWDIVYMPVLSGAGRVDGLILMSQEATARVNSELLQQRQISQLQEVDRLKNDFLSILSHELRTPINAIMGFASILDDEVAGPLNEAQHGFAERILSGSSVLLALIEDLLDMSRIQAGKFTLRTAPIAPGAVIDEAVSALAPLAEQRRQSLAIHLPPMLPMLVADEQRVRQVITNLLGNAIKFGGQGDTIIVRARMDGDWLTCEVEDHGDGIAADDLPKLFQRFTQLDGGNSRKAGGAGLGLSIVKALVEAHGGEVGARSRPRSETVFWFTLPLKPATGPKEPV